MLIGIDIRTVCRQKTGKGWYTYHLVRELLIADKKNEYILYTDKLSGECADFSSAHIQLINGSGILWHLKVIKDFLDKKGALFFAPTSYIVPALMPKKIKTVVMVHDLIAFLKISAHQNKATIIEKLFLRFALNKAEKILVPSESTKKDLIKKFGFLNKAKNKSRIFVTPEAAGDEFKIKPKNLNEVRKKYDLPEKFLLTVGGLQPRKNISRLIDAVEDSKEKIQLVIVGDNGWNGEESVEKIAASKKILQITNCSSEDLIALYHLATIFIFPSLYEGFGLPILEAMAAGCPVICSNSSSLPEVASDAAIMIDPLDTDKMRDAITNLWNNEKLRGELIKKGHTQTASFTWKKTAELTLKAFS